MGGSYGGYMALAAATFAPDDFGANVDLFGVSDLKSLVGSFPAYWASGAAEIYVKFGNPKDPADAAYQHDQSPLNFLDKVKKPLLVVQGDKDARVKKDQSDRMVQGLKARGVPVHYLVLENEGTRLHQAGEHAAQLRADRPVPRSLPARRHLRHRGLSRSPASTARVRRVSRSRRTFPRGRPRSR